MQSFRAAVSGAKDVQSLLANPAVMKVLLTANGLSDQIAYTALAQKALHVRHKRQQFAREQAFGHTLEVGRADLRFRREGAGGHPKPKVLDTIANAYAEVTWRQSLDAATPGLSNALTFREQASGITSVDQILGDPVMRAVVTTALGIPQQIAFQDLSAQEQAISSRLDITQVPGPEIRREVSSSAT